MERNTDESKLLKDPVSANAVQLMQLRDLSRKIGHTATSFNKQEIRTKS